MKDKILLPKSFKKMKKNNHREKIKTKKLKKIK